MTKVKADLALILVTMGWGISFILTKNTLSDLPPYNFLAIRFLLASFMSAAVFHKRMGALDRATLKHGLVLGTLLFSMYAFQTVGLVYTTVSKSAFISGFSVVLVPTLSFLIFRNIPSRTTTIGVLLAFAGLGLLTLNDDLSVNIGDLLTLVCAVLFALYILGIERYSSHIDAISSAVIQIGVVGFLSLIMSFIFEEPHMPADSASWLNIIFLSIVCTSGAFIIQNVAQKYTSATHTALIFICEPLFSALFVYLLHGELLGHRELTGCALIVLGMVCAEIDFADPFINKTGEQKGDEMS